MSVTIHWRPATEKAKHFSGGTSTSLKKLEEVFGGRLRPQDVGKLRAMAIAAEDKFYDEVADKIESVGCIDIWGEY